MPIEQYEPTCEFRWFVPKQNSNSETGLHNHLHAFKFRILQQAWTSSNGSVKWIEIPEEIEK